MKNFNVSFQYSENVYCSNIAIAECKEDVEKHYSHYAWIKVSEASEYDLKEAKAKGKPIITIEHQEPTENTTEATETAEKNTSYAIINNEQFKSLEVSFNKKPSEEVRNVLKGLGFRWHGVKKVWYGYADRETVEKALQGEQITAETAPKAAKPARFDKEAITAEYAKAWSNEHMIKYCVNSLAGVAILPNGDIISVEKQKIETRFCFGESGYDYEDAQRMAQHARTSEDYFRTENMKEFDSWVKDLEEARNMNGRYYIIIRDIHYTGQSEDCKLRGLDWVRDVKLLDACGGSANLEELPGKHIDALGGRVATPEEIEIILEAYKTAREDHRKKVETYLKRYGLSKVDSWTYWREA